MTTDTRPSSPAESDELEIAPDSANGDQLVSDEAAAEEVSNDQNRENQNRDIPQTVETSETTERPPAVQWFYGLPVADKQLTGLFASKAISALGFIGISLWLLSTMGHRQLVDQADAELSATVSGLNDEVADPLNDNIVQAAERYANDSSLQAQILIQDDVQPVLRAEMISNQLEYVALVGPDLKVIASGGADRSGDTFNPDDLVSSALTAGQIQVTTSLLSLEALQQLGVSIPKDAEAAALVRYRVTPIFASEDPAGEASPPAAAIGALVTGNRIDGELAAVTDALRRFPTGFTAVYRRDLGDGLTLIGQGSGTDIAAPKSDLEDERLGVLTEAIEAAPAVVSEQIKQPNGDRYTLAAKAIVNSNNEPVGVVVRGLPEATIGQRLRQALWLLLGVGVLALLVDVIIARLLGRSIARPARNLQAATERFALGDRTARADVFARDEVGQAAKAFNALAEAVSTSESYLQFQSETQTQLAQREQQLTRLVTQIRETSDREEIFRTVTREVKAAIRANRVVVYTFDSEWQGTIVAEAVDPEWPRTLGSTIADPCFAENYVEQYRTGRVKATADIYKAGLTNCHLGQLEPLMVRANLVAPIVVEDRLLGLLIAHDCEGPRNWSALTTNFVQRAATQLGYALEQAEVTLQKELALAQTQALSEERLQRQERLQGQLLDLLNDVEAVADGNLTVRANVSAGEIGTVADFFNVVVENLRQIVTQVKRSAQQVNVSLSENEGAIRTLAEEALQQAEQTALTLESMGAMTASIQQVAQQAQAAATVARTASETASAGEEAMDLTVSNILALRQAVGQTARKVKRLGDSSQQINKAVLLISQISQQTNLLAINAGIEAARAGEEGQGFAAVAEEVSELATRSATATEEIGQIVETIQRETLDVVEAIEQSTAQVAEGTRQVEDAKTSLNQILAGSQKMDDLARMISETTGSQVETSVTVSQLIAKVAQLSQRTSASSRQASEALQQTVAIAQSLQDQVATFTVMEE
ncbi:MAG: methyl-accepting chemotaxis protein [Phormidesmis sp.]